MYTNTILVASLAAIASAQVPEPMRAGIPMPPLAGPISQIPMFFDLSKISNVDTREPVGMLDMYEPEISKFAPMSFPVMHTGESYYIPVCDISTVMMGSAEGRFGAPSNAAMVPHSATRGCQLSVAINPVPRNVATVVSRISEMLMREIRLQELSGTSLAPSRVIPGATAFMPGSQFY